MGDLTARHAAQAHDTAGMMICLQPCTSAALTGSLFSDDGKGNCPGVSGLRLSQAVN